MNKIALIIGNNDYPDSQLNNAVNDATEINAKLKHLGFTCLLLTNVDTKSMEQGLRDFGSQLDENEVGLIFFAGHGMQINGRNYLTAIDTNFETELDAKYSSLALDKVIDTMEKHSQRTSILILDACRTNPYERRWRGEARGLAPVYAPKGMIIAYATSPGQVASDGNSTNGAYTQALLQHVSTQDITIEDLFKRVRNTLSTFTNEKQISWEHTSLMGDFYFNHSLLTKELVSEYSSKAIADQDYHPALEPVRGIITSLKSHTWQFQNAAMTRLRSIDFSNAEKDDLLVLGRNIYQAACGTAGTAMTFLQELSNRLDRIGPSASFHILNGILFEIYFNSEGRKRKQGKVDMIDDVFALEREDAWKASFEFIRNALTPYDKELFYIPGSTRDVILNIRTKESLDLGRVILGIYFEGDNVLFDSEGKTYPTPANEHRLMTKMPSDISAMIAEGVIAPTYKITVNYDQLALGYHLPFDCKIQRFSS